jgi:MinD superfamily P-loop ATPase
MSKYKLNSIILSDADYTQSRMKSVLDVEDEQTQELIDAIAEAVAEKCFNRGVDEVLIPSALDVAIEALEYIANNDAAIDDITYCVHAEEALAKLKGTQK